MIRDLQSAAYLLVAVIVAMAILVRQQPRATCWCADATERVGNWLQERLRRAARSMRIHAAAKSDQQAAYRKSHDWHSRVME